jgi:hypothetical protein
MPKFANKYLALIVSKKHQQSLIFKNVFHSLLFNFLKQTKYESYNKIFFACIFPFIW